MHISVLLDTSIDDRTRIIVIKNFVGDDIFDFNTSRKQPQNTFFLKSTILTFKQGSCYDFNMLFFYNDLSIF